MDRELAVDHLSRDLPARSMRSGAAMLGAQAARFALQIGSTVVLARLLTPADFGLVAMLTVVTGFLALFTGLGLSSATVQRAEVSRAQVSLLFWVSAGAGLALCAATALLAPALAAFYGEPRLEHAALALAPTFAASGLAVQHRALLRRQMRFGALAAIDTAALAVGIAVGIAMALRGHGYWSLVGMTAAPPCAAALGLWIACPWRPSLRLRGAQAGSLLAFGGQVSGFNLLNYASGHVDKLLLGWLAGAGPLGLYSRAHQLAHLPLQQINAPLSGVFVASLSRLRDEPGRYRRTYLGALEKLALVTTPLLALGIFTADWLVRLVLGPQWDAAAPLFALLALSVLGKPVGNTAGWLLVSQDRAPTLLRWGALNAVLRFTAVGIGLPWGALGVASALAVRSFVALPLLLWIVGSRGPVTARDIYGALRLPAAVLAASALALAGVRTALPGAGGPAALALAAAAVVAACAAVLTASPAGRRALQELGRSLRLLRARKAAAG